MLWFKKKWTQKQLTSTLAMNLVEGPSMKSLWILQVRLNKNTARLVYKGVRVMVFKGEQNQLMIWGFTEFRTNKKMKI